MARRMWAEAITLGDLVRRSAEEYADREALVFPTERLTYREFAQRTETYARALRAMKVGPGDHVAILGPNSPNYLVIIFAAATIGAVAVPVNARFKTDELGYVIAHADIKVLFTTSEISEHVDYPALLEETFPGLSGQRPDALEIAQAPELRAIVLNGPDRPGFLPLHEAIARAEEIEPAAVDVLAQRVRLRDAAILMYTSGTTARPKGCILTHESLSRNGAVAAHAKFELTKEDRFWDPLPFFHMSVILPFLCCMSVGACMISTTRFDPDEALDALVEEQVTVAYPCFETIWQPVLTNPRFDEVDLSRIRLQMLVGTPERLRQVQEKLPGAAVISAFGSTEGAGTAAYNHPNDPLEDRLTTAGTPFPGVQVKTIDENGDEVPAGERGELCFRGYNVFEGYYKDLEKTAEVLDEDGWFHSGDLGVIDKKGQVSYRGRLKDMLKIGGENVAAVEIEDYIATHPKVKIVQVVAAPDDKYTEVAAAFVELVPGEAATAEDLVDYCRGRIASYKVPRHVRFVQEWPMSGTKVKKYELRDRITAELTGVTAT